MAAAADLAPLQQDLAGALGSAAGLPVRFTFAGSGILARQIENGAPYDLYLSANEQFVRQLEARGKVVTGSVTVYAHGALGLWSKSGKVRSLQDIRGALALPNPVHAPYGAAARDMLKKFGLWTQLEPKIVYGENVLQAFQFAESGNADACITSWTLVRDKGGVQLPLSDYPRIAQVGAVVAGSRHTGPAGRALAWLVSPEGKKLLAAHGLAAP